jgi:hypothetical protein
MERRQFRHLIVAAEAWQLSGQFDRSRFESCSSSGDAPAMCDAEKEKIVGVVQGVGIGRVAQQWVRVDYDQEGAVEATTELDMSVPSGHDRLLAAQTWPAP